MEASCGRTGPGIASAVGEAETLLAGVAVRPFARSALRTGVEAVSVDYFGDRDHRRDLPVLSLRRDAGVEEYSAADLVELARRVRAGEVAYGADLENHPRQVHRLSHGRRLLGNPPDVLRRARDPFRVAALLRGKGLRVPQLRTADEPPDPDGREDAWLRKPRRGGGGRGVRPWRGEQALTRREYLQERIGGTPVGVLFVADGREGRVLAVTEMLVGREAFGASGFLFCGSLLRRGPKGRPLPPRGGRACGPLEAGRVVSALTRGLGLRGLNGVDAVLRDGRLWPLEVNPRWTASMELLEVGVRAGTALLPRALFALHRRACRGELPAADALPGGGPGSGEATPREVVGKAIVRARRETAAPDLPRLDGLAPIPAVRRDADEAANGRATAVVLADVPEPGDPLPEGGPVCTLLASAGDREGCLGKLEAGAARVHRALAER